MVVLEWEQVGRDEVFQLLVVDEAVWGKKVSGALGSQDRKEG